MSTHELMPELTSSAQLLDTFSNFRKLAAIGLVIPVSMVNCERDFSVLGRHNRLSSTVLNALMTISIKGPENNE